MREHLLSLSEAAERVGLSLSRIYNLRCRYPDDFPPERERRGCMPLFARADIDYWRRSRIDRRKRKRARSRK